MPLDSVAPSEMPMSVPVAPAHRALGGAAKVGAGQSPSCRGLPYLLVEAAGKAQMPPTTLTPVGLHVHSFIHSALAEVPPCPALCWRFWGP